MRGKNAATILAVSATLLFLVTNFVPGVQAQASCEQASMCPSKSTPTSLYFHVFDVFNAFPINTQTPHPGFFKVGGTNFPSVVEPNTQTNYDFNTIYGYSTSGPVEYDFIENGQPRFHPERGLAANVKIDDQAAIPYGGGAAPAIVHIYVSLRDVSGKESAPNFMPAYTFRVEMKEKNQVGDTADLDSGTLIMHGEKTAHLARGAKVCANPSTCVDGNQQLGSQLGNKTDPNGVPILVPNADGIIEYEIPMQVEAGAVMPKKEGYHIRIDWYQNTQADQPGTDKAAEGYMRLVSNDQYHPRLDLAIKNPVYIDFIHPEVAAGILLIHTAENSPWGTYDVDVANITVQVKDSGGKVVDAKLQQVISQNSHVHNLHDKSAEVTYLWRYRGDPDNGIPSAPDGDYTITVTVQNNAHTATATGTAGFHLEGKKAYGIAENGQTVTAGPDLATVDKKSPDAGLFVIATVFAAAFVLRRRQA